MAPPRPGEHRIPGWRRPYKQRRRTVGAIGDKIAFAEHGEARRKQGGVRRDPVDGCVGEPRQRHGARVQLRALRSEEHTSELQSLMRISYAVFCLKKKKQRTADLMSQRDTDINREIRS